MDSLELKTLRRLPRRDVMPPMNKLDDLQLITNHDDW
jgi:hypothetical protein|tara:strand:- start:282 stop:392 length:111 start_codon:yes stop_codon:yes gene_type:complete